jgi:hypothetical protein
VGADVDYDFVLVWLVVGNTPEVHIVVGTFL